MLSPQPILKQPACYQIRNTITNERYVGATKNLYGRAIDHRCKLKHGRHESAVLQLNYDQYGRDAFVIEVIESTAAPFDRELEEFVMAYQQGERLLDAASKSRAIRWLESPAITFNRAEVMAIYRTARKSAYQKVKARQAAARRL